MSGATALAMRSRDPAELFLLAELAGEAGEGVLARRHDPDCAAGDDDEDGQSSGGGRGDWLGCLPLGFGSTVQELTTRAGAQRAMHSRST